MRNRLVRLASVLAVITLAEVGCGSAGVEEQVLRAFFDASRARDTTMLAKVATVSFNPVTEWTVRDFDVTEVADERTNLGVLTKLVTVRAQVHTPRDHVVSTMLVFTFRRAAGEPSSSTNEGRWMITDVRPMPLPASRTLREESSALPN